MNEEEEEEEEEDEEERKHQHRLTTAHLTSRYTVSSARSLARGAYNMTTR